MSRLGALWRQAHEVEDDTGRTHEMRIGEWPKAPAWRDARTRQTMRHALRLTRGSGGLRVFLWVVVYGFTFWIVFGLTSPLVDRSSALANVAVVVASLLVAGILSSLLLHLNARSGRWLVVMFMKRRSLCPVCAYDLRQIPVDASTGLTTCPECGAARRVGEPPSPLP